MAYDFHALDLVWADLPALPGMRARWLGPLVEAGFAAWIGDLSEAAYGHLETCGWLDDVRQMGPMMCDDGTLEPAWVTALDHVANLLAREGARAGPESDPERWRSWLVWELAAPHAWASDIACSR